MSDQPAPANKPSSANKQQKQKQSNTRKGKKPMQQQQTAKQQQPQKQKNKATPRQVMMTWEDELPGALHRRFSKLQWDIKQKARTQVQQTQRQGRETLLNQKRGNKTSSMPQVSGRRRVMDVLLALLSPGCMRERCYLHCCCRSRGPRPARARLLSRAAGGHPSRERS